MTLVTGGGGGGAASRKGLRRLKIPLYWLVCGVRKACELRNPQFSQKNSIFVATPTGGKKF